MASKTLYYCDDCGDEKNEEKLMKLTVDPRLADPSLDYNTPKVVYGLCPDCWEKRVRLTLRALPIGEVCPHCEGRGWTKDFYGPCNSDYNDEVCDYCAGRKYALFNYRHLSKYPAPKEKPREKETPQENLMYAGDSPEGYEIMVGLNEIGARRYFTTEHNAMVWDTTLCSPQLMAVLMGIETHLHYREQIGPEKSAKLKPFPGYEP